MKEKSAKKRTRASAQARSAQCKKRNAASAVAIVRRHAHTLANHRIAAFPVKGKILLFLLAFHLIFVHGLFPFCARFVAVLLIARAGSLTRQHDGTLHSEKNSPAGCADRFRCVTASPS